MSNRVGTTPAPESAHVFRQIESYSTTVTAPDGTKREFGGQDIVDRPAAPGLGVEPTVTTAGALPTPRMLTPAVTRGIPRNVDAATLRATRELVEAVDTHQWGRATRAANLLSSRLSRVGKDVLSDDARDEIHLALSDALGQAEEADDWSFFETLLGVLLLGLPFLADALITTDAERLKDLAAKTRLKMSKQLAGSLVSYRSGAQQADADLVSAELAQLPPAILRTLAASGTRIYAVRNDVYAGMHTRRDEMPPDVTLGLGSLRGAADKASGTINILTQKWAIGGPKIPHSARMGASTVLHEAMHAYNNCTGASRSPEFLAALHADERPLSMHEAQPDSGLRAEETYAETCARYLGGDHSLKHERPNLWRYCLTMFGPR